ncbi:phosphoserine phosphatase [Vibrio sinaloensis DSM 21326]|uniref:Phosphoserine phosphatase n=1 Tax=Vibrio sinaloensis DSM 21326 TaxID=945550 RepID=E8M881_PHOS4|nr:HAD-IB family phosphatase [Vibrio sinaloensis]EGA69773.1 phosphoserine phosphatase [Vibrio sinaloensis DSM 21326]
MNDRQNQLPTRQQSATLALFDFDGTITTQDTYTKFLFYTTPKLRLVIGFVLVWPVVLLYKLGYLPACRTRPVLSRVAFWRRKVARVDHSAEQYVRDYLPSVIRPEMQAKILWHQANGDEVYVVSASLSPYLTVWCKQQGIRLICSELETKADRYTGLYVNGDCSKGRKVSFLKRQVTLANYQKIYAYGDTDEDLAMLSIADVKFFRGESMTSESR